MKIRKLWKYGAAIILGLAIGSYTGRAQVKLEILSYASTETDKLLFYEGFTLSYNILSRTSDWVAYELTDKELLGSVPRERNFFEDPDLKVPQATDDDYRNSGWSRGHMAPAGDMKWSQKAMIQSCYYTNICPQSAKLNNGGWKSLEDTCRRWAEQYGRIYIVCGPIFSDNPIKIGHNRVWVPDKFFKAILIPVGGSYECAGYTFTNSDQTQRAIMPIDELEAITGIDFFPNLPDDIETAIEKIYNNQIFR